MNYLLIIWYSERQIKNILPNGRSNVFDGVRTTGNDERCFPPRRKPVQAVSTSDIIPGSSSNRGP